MKSPNEFLRSRKEKGEGQRRCVLCSSSFGAGPRMVPGHWSVDVISTTHWKWVRCKRNSQRSSEGPRKRKSHAQATMSFLKTLFKSTQPAPSQPHQQPQPQSAISQLHSSWTHIKVHQTRERPAENKTTDAVCWVFPEHIVVACSSESIASSNASGVPYRETLGNSRIRNFTYFTIYSHHYSLRMSTILQVSYLALSESTRIYIALTTYTFLF